MLKTFRTGKDNQYGFKRRLIIACGNYIARKPVELSTEQLAYEITIAFYYDKETYIKLDYIDLCIIIRTLVSLKITPQGKIEIFKLWQNRAINQIDVFGSQAIANTFTAITKLKVNEKIELPQEETEEILKALTQEAKRKRLESLIRKKSPTPYGL